MQTMCEDTACGAETALTLRLSCIPWKGTSPAPSGKYRGTKIFYQFAQKYCASTREVLVLRQPGSQLLLWRWHHKKWIPQGEWIQWLDSVLVLSEPPSGSSECTQLWCLLAVFSLSCFLWPSLLDWGLSIGEVPQLHAEKCTHGLQNLLRNEGCAPWWSFTIS